jgi:hypothetical protein
METIADTFNSNSDIEFAQTVILLVHNYLKATDPDFYEGSRRRESARALSVAVALCHIRCILSYSTVHLPRPPILSLPAKYRQTYEAR